MAKVKQGPSVSVQPLSSSHLLQGQGCVPTPSSAWGHGSRPIPQEPSPPLTSQCQPWHGDTWVPLQSLGDSRGRLWVEKRGQQSRDSCHKVAGTPPTGLHGTAGPVPQGSQGTRESQAGLWPAPLGPDGRVTARSDSVRPHSPSPWPLGCPGEMVTGGWTPVGHPAGQRAAATSPNSTEHLHHHPAPPSSPF